MFLRLSPVAFVAAWHLLSSLLVLSTIGSNLEPVLAHTPDRDDSERDVILFWNNEALDTVRELHMGAFDAARTYAMVNAAMFDAIIGIAGFKFLNPAVVDASPAFNIPRTVPVKKAAANAAAHAVLSNLFPGRAATYDSIKQQVLESLPNSYKANKKILRATDFGADVGAEVYSIRLPDGTNPEEALTGETGSTSFADMEGFIIADASACKSQGPPATNSREYFAAHTEVRLLGDASYENQEYDEIFRFWKAGGGTVRPPGEWIKTAIVLADDTELRLLQTATLFATLSLGLADTAIVVASDKEDYQYWRPATAIRAADDDGNLDTMQDGTWKPRNGSIGGSPEHTSGQSAFAGCASTILAEFFHSNEIEFTIEGDNAIAGPRTYSSFSEAAAEAGRSRIFSGIHFEFSNQAGQQSGRDVAREVLKWQEPHAVF